MLSYIKYLQAYCKSNQVLYSEIQYPISSGFNRAIYLKPYQPRKRLILVCHGLGADKFYPFTELFIDYLQNGFHVFSIDLDGHGKENSHFFSYPEILQTVPAAIEFIRRSLYVYEEEVILMGHSLGGILCLYHSQKNKCRGIITVSTPHLIKLRKTVFLEILSLFNPNILRQLRYYTLYDLLPAFYNFKRRDFPCRIQQVNKSYLESVKETINKIPLTASIRQSSVPYLQIHGKLDCIVPYKDAQIIHQHYKGEKELLTVKYGSHFSTLFNPKCREKILLWSGSL